MAIWAVTKITPVLPLVAGVSLNKFLLLHVSFSLEASLFVFLTDLACQTILKSYWRQFLSGGLNGEMHDVTHSNPPHPVLNIVFCTNNCWELLRDCLWRVWMFTYLLLECKYRMRSSICCDIGHCDFIFKHFQHWLESGIPFTVAFPMCYELHITGICYNKLAKGPKAKVAWLAWKSGFAQVIMVAQIVMDHGSCQLFVILYSLSLYSLSSCSIPPRDCTEWGSSLLLTIL